MRYGMEGETFVDKHGAIEGGDFMNNFQSISDFLNFHPYEFIVVKI